MILKIYFVRLINLKSLTFFLLLLVCLNSFAQSDSIFKAKPLQDAKVLGKVKAGNGKTDTAETILEFEAGYYGKGRIGIVSIWPDSAIYEYVDREHKPNKVKLNNTDWQNLINLIKGYKVIDLVKESPGNPRKLDDCVPSSITITTKMGQYKAEDCYFSGYVHSRILTNLANEIYKIGVRK